MIHSNAYYIRHGYGLFPIRNRREAKALYEFCLEQLSEEDFCKLNPAKAEVFRNTVTLYHDDFDEPFELHPSIHCKCGCCNKQSYWTFYDYVQDHCGWYWS